MSEFGTIERITDFYFNNCVVKWFDDKTGIIRIVGKENGTEKSMRIFIIDADCSILGEEIYAATHKPNRQPGLLDFLHITNVSWDSANKLYRARIVQIV